MLINETTYVDEAEKVILQLKNKTDQRGKSIDPVTTSKLRNLLAMTADIYNEVLGLKEDRLNSELVGRIDYLRVRFLYEAGRDPKVKDLVLTARLCDVLREIKGSRQNYILFSRYMEALVAFRKYYCPEKD